MKEHKRDAPPKPRGRTGPRSISGKRRASTNARKHGLSVPITRDPDFAPEVAALARKIADGDEELAGLAGAIAEAELEVLRVRRLRSDLTNRGLTQPRFETAAKHKHMLSVAMRILTAWHAGREFLPDDAANLMANENLAYEKGPPRHARVLEGLAKQLGALDRYERRALSRREFAIREFDAMISERAADCPVADFGRTN